MEYYLQVGGHSLWDSYGTSGSVKIVTPMVVTLLKDWVTTGVYRNSIGSLLVLTIIVIITDSTTLESL